MRENEGKMREKIFSNRKRPRPSNPAPYIGLAYLPATS